MWFVLRTETHKCKRDKLQKVNDLLQSPELAMNSSSVLDGKSGGLRRAVARGLNTHKHALWMCVLKFVLLEKSYEYTHIHKQKQSYTYLMFEESYEYTQTLKKHAYSTMMYTPWFILLEESYEYINTPTYIGCLWCFRNRMLGDKTSWGLLLFHKFL